uniref:Peptidase S1 domain-containing protein n=1 Tax=Panagrolaimus sp. PS1159 TaxID=55785 RepID=A0AC35F979_9BILA
MIFGDLPIDSKCGESMMIMERVDFTPQFHRLVGGMETVPHAWPWTVQITFRDHHHCGAALIHPEIVLTAAHCFGRSKIPTSYRAFVGGHKIYSGTEHIVTKILIHPLYHMFVSSAYDAALIRISPPVNISDPMNYAGTVCMPTLPPPNGQMCVVTGWGYESETGRRTGVLREIHVPIVPSISCNNPWHYNGKLHLPTMFCAGYSMGKVDSCQGDSGGPLVCYNKPKDIWELQGLVSWGFGCAKPGFPGVYSKVHAFIPWINTSIKQLLQ